MVQCLDSPQHHSVCILKQYSSWIEPQAPSVVGQLEKHIWEINHQLFMSLVHFMSHCVTYLRYTTLHNIIYPTLDNNQLDDIALQYTHRYNHIHPHEAELIRWMICLKRWQVQNKFLRNTGCPYPSRTTLMGEPPGLVDTSGIPGLQWL